MPEEELFDIAEVRVELKPEDMPGRPITRVACDICGEYVQDGREVHQNGSLLCRSYAGDSYYSVGNSIFSAVRYAKKT
jgi:formylmethanofuran dehydrogenase subunit E